MSYFVFYRINKSHTKVMPLNINSYKKSYLQISIFKKRSLFRCTCDLLPYNWRALWCFKTSLLIYPELFAPLLLAPLFFLSISLSFIHTYTYRKAHLTNSLGNNRGLFMWYPRVFLREIYYFSYWPPVSIPLRPCLHFTPLNLMQTPLKCKQILIGVSRSRCNSCRRLM